jgi:hypothetical protein
MPRDRRLLAIPVVGLIVLIVLAVVLSRGGDSGKAGTKADVEVTPTEIVVPAKADPPSQAQDLAPGDYSYPFTEGAGPADMHVKVLRCDAENLLELQTEKSTYFVVLAPELNLFCSKILPQMLDLVTKDEAGKTIAVDKKRFGIRMFEDANAGDPAKRFGINLIWEPGPVQFFQTPSVKALNR